MDKYNLEALEHRDIILNKHWFFHATTFNIDIVEKILKEGITCPYIRNNQDIIGNNGPYYISLSKFDLQAQVSAFDHYIDCPLFIIENIRPFHANKTVLFSKTILPIRGSFFDDEYQYFWKIKPSKIVAMGLNLQYYYNYASSIREPLLFLKKAILIQQKLDLNLPIYDVCAQKEIDKEAILSLKL